MITPEDDDRPGAYSFMVMVGPVALAKLIDGDRGGATTDTAAGIVDRLIAASSPDELADMVRYAVDRTAQALADARNPLL